MGSYTINDDLSAWTDAKLYNELQNVQGLSSNQPKRGSRTNYGDAIAMLQNEISGRESGAAARERADPKINAPAATPGYAPLPGMQYAPLPGMAAGGGAGALPPQGTNLSRALRQGAPGQAPGGGQIDFFSEYL